MSGWCGVYCILLLWCTTITIKLTIIIYLDHCVGLHLDHIICDGECLRLVHCEFMITVVHS